jgi:tRNA threonylcarbamoyladenosine biosynthesis protein TsaE
MADRPGRLASPGSAFCLRVSVPGAASMRELGRRLAGLLRPGDLVVLAGPLGAGKTTLVQGIGAGLAVRGPITSPSFVISRVHPSLRGGPDLVHADAYRLGSRLEVDDLDLDAELDRCVTVVEWGEGLVEELAPARLQITIERPQAHPDDVQESGTAEPGDELRLVTVAGYGDRWRDAARSLRSVLNDGQW